MHKKILLTAIAIILINVILISAITNYNANFIAKPTQTLSYMDSSKRDLIAKVYNQTWLDFDGSNYVTIGSNDLLSYNKSNAYTISAWIYVTNFSWAGSGSSGLKRVVSKGATNQYEFSLHIFNETSGTANQSGIQFFTSTGANLCLKTSGVALKENQWNYIVGSYNGSNCSIYQNGINLGTGAKAAVSSNNGTASIRIGSMAASSTVENFIGNIDDIKIYNTSLDNKLVRRFYNESILGKSIPVLSYHQVNESGIAETIINLTNFQDQMDYLNSSGYETITLDDYYNWRNDNFTMPSKPIILEFDDGWTNIYTNAVPIMDAYGYVGVSLVITSYAESENPLYMNWTILRLLINKGWQVGSHSKYHCDMLTNCNTTANWIREFNESKASLIANLSITPTLFQYPFNSNNNTSDTLCSSYYPMCSGWGAGTNTYENFLFKTANLTHETGNPIGIKRIIITNSTNLNEFKNSFDYFNGLIVNFPINENNGTIIYDISNGNNGTISGATWNNDEVLRTLINIIDYSIVYTTGLFTINNNDYLYSYIIANWLEDKNELSNPANPFFSAFQLIYGMGGVIILVALAGLTLATFKFKKLNIYQYVSAVMGILISAWILGSILSAVS